MKDKNYDGRSNRVLRIGKTIPLAATLILPILFSEPVFAEDVVEGYVTHQKIVQNSQPENLAPDSQPLSLDAVSAAPIASSTVSADQPLPAAPTQLALATGDNSNDIFSVNAVDEQTAIDDRSLKPAVGEASQKHYPLMLALLAIISLVPISRRH